MFVTLGVVTLPFQEVVGTDVLGVQEVGGICKVYENHSHYQGYFKYSSFHFSISYSSFKNSGNSITITYQIIIILNDKIHHTIEIVIHQNSKNVEI